MKKILTMEEKRKKYEELSSKYEMKTPVAGKCWKKYFLNGFLYPFNPSQQKYCPYCCSKVTDEEYFEPLGLWTFGCKNCREELSET